MRASMLTLADDGCSCVLSFTDGTKTANRRMAASEALEIRDPLTLLAVRRLRGISSDFLAGDFLSGVTPKQFVQLFTKAVVFLQLGDKNIRPYSIRRGGTTHHFRMTGNMSDTVVRG